MRIFFNETEYLDVITNDSSQRYRRIMGKNEVAIDFSLSVYRGFLAGCYIEYQGERYYCLTEASVKKISSLEYEYQIVFEPQSGKLRLWTLRNIAIDEFRFSAAYTPRELLGLIVENLNLRDNGWSVGICINSDHKTFSFDNTKLDIALAMGAESFNTEFEIINKTISYKKIEYGKDNPLSLSYGMGNGFLPGVGRISTGTQSQFEILLVQGGDRNLDRQRYESSRWHLPKSAQLTYKDVVYLTDDKGREVTIAGKKPTTKVDSTLSLVEMYPQRVGVISSVIVVSEENNFVDFVDISIPESLDYAQYRIGGEAATIEFQSGMLAGRTFDIDQTADALTGYIHAERRFRLVPKTEDGIVMPYGVFMPAVGDKYIVFGVMLPDAYTADDNTKTGLEWDMFREACRYFSENNVIPFTFSGELDGKWAKQDWINRGGMLNTGWFIRFSDPDFKPEGYDIRIVGVRDFLHDPCSLQLELSNEIVAVNLTTSFAKLDAFPEQLDRELSRNYDYTNRSFADAKRTAEMLVESKIDGFSASVNPLTVTTMQLLVGSSELQFAFVNSKTAPQVVVNKTQIFNKYNKTLTAEGGIVKHYTIGIDYIGAGHKLSEYRYWDVPGYTSAALTDKKGMYLYLRCSANSSTSSYKLSFVGVAMNEESGWYHFLVGVLNPEIDNSRSFAPMYGFSLIEPGRIVADRFQSSDFDWDLFTGACIDFSSNPKRIILGGNAEIITNSLTIRKPGVNPYKLEDKVEADYSYLNGRIDGITESFYENYDPDLTNEPAKGWISEGTEERHLKSSFTNFKTGASWLWTKNNLNIYGWGVITNTEILNALKVAGEAKEAAALAKATAESAQTSANTANSLISDIANDNKLTADEKQSTKKEWDIIESEKTKNNVSASTFGVSSTAYIDSYNLLESYITPLLDNLNVTSDIVGTTFRGNFKSYYDARTDLLNAISLKAKTLADSAQSTATNADKIAVEAKKAALYNSIAAQWSSGNILYKDPTFSLGNNGINPYVAGPDGAFGNMRIASSQPYIPAGSPILSPYMYMCETTAMPGIQRNRYGFYFGTPSRAGAIFVTRIIANIPIGFVLSFASNAFGNYSKYIFTTPREGTGKWEEYIMIAFCGKEGTFHSTNFYYLERIDMNDPTTAPLSYSRWFVSYATVSDITDARNAALDAVQSLDRQKAMADDNIISREEKVTLRNENTQIVKQYDSLKTLAGASVNTTYLDTAHNDVQILFGSGFVNIASDTDYTFKASERNTYNTYLANWAFQCNRISELIAQKQLDDLSIGGVNILNIFPNKTNTIYKSIIANDDGYGHHPQFFELTQQNYRDIEKAGALTIAFDYNIQNAKLRTLGNTFIGFSFWIKYTDGSVVNPYYNTDGGTKILYDGNALTKKGTLVSVTPIDKTKTIDSITSTQPHIYIRNITQGSAEYTNFRWYVGSKDIGYQPTQREQEEYAKERAELSAKLAKEGVPTKGLVAYYPLENNADDIWGGYNGVPTSMSYFENQKFGNIGEFNGSSSKITMHNIIQGLSAVNTFTMSFFAKAAQPQRGDIFGVRPNSPNNIQGFQVCIESNMIRFWYYTTSWQTFDLMRLELNTFYTISCTLGGNFLKIYLNGALAKTIEAQMKILEYTRFAIGVEPQSANAYFFQGNIGKVSIHNRALSENEIYDLSSQNLSYLAKAYKEASELDTIVSGGLILTSVIGLKNAVGKLKVFFSGLTTGKTSDIAIATGIPDDGNIDNAKTRLMMNGAFHAEEAFITGLIRASSGKLGGFNLNGNSISNLDELGGVILTKDNISSVQSLLAQTTTTPANYVEKTDADTITSANYTYSKGSVAPRNVSSVVGVQLANEEMLYSLEMNISYLNYSTSAPSITLISNLKIEIWIGNFQGGTIQVGEFKLDKPTQTEGNPAANVKLNFSTTPNNSFLYIKVVGLSITINEQSAYYLALKNIKIIKSVTTTIYANDGFGIASSSSNFIYYKKGYGFAMKIGGRGGKAYIDNNNYLRFDPNLEQNEIKQTK